MKEQVLDMALVLKSINGKIDSLTQQLNTVTQQLDIANKEIMVLKVRLAVYEAPKDSHNSSIPPSKQSLVAQMQKSNELLATRSLREKSSKPSGGQVGHKGTTLEMVSNPDSVIEHQSNYCKRCGNSLGDIEGSVTEVRQLFDIPIPTLPIVTEHRVIEKKCSCGHCNNADFPVDVRSRVSYGQNIKALVVYLSCIQFIPYKRLTEVLRDCFGVSLSQGTIDNILNDMSDKSLGAYNEILNRIKLSPVVGADETGENVNGELKWIWTWQTKLLTYLMSEKSRGGAAIKKHFENGLPNAVLISDRHASYYKMNVAGHQICLAHILRELIYLNELDTSQRWSAELAELIREAIHARKTVQWDEIDRKSILERFQNLLNQSTDNLHQKIIAIQKSLTKYKDYVFKFLFHPDVPYDNNASERTIRIVKIKQKVSGMFKSDQGANTFCQIQSIAQTAKKNNQNPFSAILAVANNY